jgi:type IV pilus assembly protein PilA
MNIPPPVPPAATPPAPAAPRRKGLSGCAITALVGAALVVVAIPVIGILAAIAIPQYQDYVVRTRVTAGYAHVRELQSRVDAWRRDHDGCPGNVDLGLPEDDRVPLGRSDAPAVGVVAVGTVDSGECAIEMRLEGVNASVDGKTLMAMSDGADWRCDAGTLEARHLPLICRNAGTPRP